MKNICTFVKIVKYFFNMYLLHNMINVYGNKYYFIQNMGDKKTLHTTIQMHKNPLFGHIRKYALELIYVFLSVQKLRPLGED